MNNQTEFKSSVLKALSKGIISKVEAKECLKRGLGEEVPLFFDFSDKEEDLRNYVLGLEKMGIIKPLFREDENP